MKYYARKIIIGLILALGAMAFMYRQAEKDADHWRDIANERERSLRVADQGLRDLVADRRECIAQTVQQETQLMQSSQALMLCAENVVKKTYLEQVKRNCTIASNRLIRLAKAGT